jgi:hypothetical protein
MTTETPIPLVDANIIRHHLTEANLSQRGAAGVLRIDERTMRRYCSGDLPVPPYVILALMQVSQMHRNAEVVALLDSGTLSTIKGPLTKERLMENNEMLRRAVDFLVGHASQLELEQAATGTTS